MSTTSAFARRASRTILAIAAVAPALILAHDHHATEEELDSAENALKPLGTKLWYHIAIQSLLWSFAFPATMVLGLTRSRWHVPLAATSTLLSLFGLYFGHHHDGREFPHSPHATVGNWLMWIMIVQASLGIFLRMHIWEESWLRWSAVKIHGLFGRLYVLLGFTQMVLGVVLGLGFCRDGHLGQCLAHFGFGMAFLAYGCTILVMSLYGAVWLSRRKLSQEFLDGSAFTFFGLIVTFTMHGFIEPVHGKGWSHKDLQHTSIGLLLTFGGGCAMFMGRKGKRNIWVALILALMGFAMSGHAQQSALSTHVHTAFGYTLMLAGLCRLIEICFLLKGQHSLPPSSASSSVNDLFPSCRNKPEIQPEFSAFQHTTPFLVITSGFMFMSANEEQISLIGGIGMDGVTYIIGLFCLGLAVYLWLNMLLSLWASSGRNASSSHSTSTRRLLSSSKDDIEYSHLTMADDNEDQWVEGSMEMRERQGQTKGYGGGRGARQSSRTERVFDADDDDEAGDSSYWDGDTQVDSDAKSIQVR